MNPIDVLSNLILSNLVLTLWEEFQHLVHLIEPYAFLIEIIVLALIIREIRALARHESALHEHGKQMEASRPLISRLHTGSDEIMDLAIGFVEEANEIMSLGTVNSALTTERRSADTDESYFDRIDKADPRTLQYIQATQRHIIAGKPYVRILDFGVDQLDEVDELLCNVRFFKRMMELQPAAKSRFRVYHNPVIFKGEGDFHFRCSDTQVIIRVGARNNPTSNAAIVITDTRVVQEFKRYYEGLTTAVTSRQLSYAELSTLEDLLAAGDMRGVNDLLNRVVV